MRTAAWTDDIADPSRDHLLLRLFPQHRIAAFRLQDKPIEELFLKSQEERTRPSAADQYKQIQEIYMKAPRRSCSSTSRPIRWRCAKVKGFVQIPLGNNIFEAAYVEK